MIRRCVWTLAMIALLATIGCGFIRPDSPWPLRFKPGTVSTGFEAPMARVIDAARDSLGDFEVTMESPKNLEFFMDPAHPPQGVVYLADQKEFVVDPEIFAMDSFLIEGKTKDGQTVKIEVQARDQGQKADVSILVGHRGDAPLSATYLERVADRLAHPVIKTAEQKEKRKIHVQFSMDFQIQNADGSIRPAEPRSARP